MLGNYLKLTEPTAIFWVVGTDYSRYAVIWSCSNLPNNRSNEQAWVVSRLPTASADVTASYMAVINRTNLDVNSLIITNQNLEECRRMP